MVKSACYNVAHFMENEKYQKELFDEFKQPKRQKHGFGRFFQKADFAINLSAEKLVFILIGVLMLAVVSFALGVEKGKSQAAISQGTVSTTVPQPISQNKDTVTPTNIVAKNKTLAAPVSAKMAADNPKIQYVADKSKPYTIVAAAFSREEFASKEVSRLKANGLEAFVYYGEPYYLACVGAFANKDSAQKVLVKVRQMHRDAYVRLR